MTALLEASHLSYHYPHRKPLFQDLSFSVKRGQVLTLLGPNGIGKSTLLNCLTGLLTPTAGALRLNGHPLAQLTPRDRAKLVAYVPQQLPNTSGLSVLDFVVTGRTPYLNFAQSPGVADYDLARKTLTKLKVAELATHPINTLSGGQLQLVTIARALVQEPQLIILDEPTSALDFGRQQQVLTLVTQLAHDNFAVILTTHNPNHAFILNQQVGLFGTHGQFVAGDTSLLTEERLRETYQTGLKLLFVPELHRTICELV